MAMLVDDHSKLDVSDFTTSITTSSSTATATDVDLCCNWDDWLSKVDKNGFFDHPQDDFNNLFNFEMEEDTDQTTSLLDNLASLDTMIVETPVSVSSLSDDQKGLRLIHLLTAAVEAIGAENQSQHALAKVILTRLKDLVSPDDGTNMERLASYFTDALHNILKNNGLGGGEKQTHHHRTDMLAAFQVLQDMSPYVKFGHFTANQAIVEAVSDEKRVHIIDYDIKEGIQWPSLMQALISRKSKPSIHLRITALSRNVTGKKKSVSSVQETGRRLTSFAASIGLPFSFHQCKLDSEESFEPSSIKLLRGEAIIVNCMLHLPHFTNRSPASFLSGSKSLNPKLVTLVEEECSKVESGFVCRFMDTLQQYSALYDSLEAGFPMQVSARALVERMFFGPRIIASLARVYQEKAECGSWANWMRSEKGFNPINISFSNHCQAKLLLGLFHDGYRAEESASNKLVLGWKSRRLLSASVWSYNSNSD